MIHCEQDDLNSSEEMLCKELSHTPTEGDGFFWARKSNIIWGAMVEEQQQSMKDKKDRKKYMGEPSDLLAAMVTMISRLPNIVAM